MIIVFMRQILLFIFSLVAIPVFAYVAPNSEAIGRVKIDIEKGSAADRMLQAFQEDFTDNWIDSYASGDELFAVAYAPILSNLLPMTNIVLSEEGDDSISLYSLDTKDVVYITLRDGNIVALSFRTLDSPSP